MKFTSALSGLATLCQLVYSLEDGTYFIRHYSSPAIKTSIGVTSEDSVNPIIVGGRDAVWTFKHSEGPDTFTIQRESSSELAYCIRDGCNTSTKPAARSKFRVIYEGSAEAYLIIDPAGSFAWTLANVTSGTQVKYEALDLQPQQYFTLHPVSD